MSGLSAADAALRDRLTELCVHIPCGSIRGPVLRFIPRRPERPVLWQSCRCEDDPEVWEDSDVSRVQDLCLICFRGTAGGRSRWAWHGCPDCVDINVALGRAWGVQPFRLGRHSLMNGVGVRGGAPPAVQAEDTARLVEFARGDGRLRDWRRREYRRLAAQFDPLADIPVREWQQVWPPGRAASADAFARLLDRELPLRPPR
ncbi:hypothetical protein [Mycobacterium sp. 1274756.6]|uniref:hypothetical protein n=1 Tax=Mycobacterium sp. 1274756.6 TaxID=1834076 RepID=UPI0007FF6D5F|nr:hypothetical protein [Mycobacterium sp. 1274756.6]OBJ70998.1 hypothetical protein A5643_08895 [Mycobacterium sp. 1274756.6]